MTDDIDKTQARLELEEELRRKHRGVSIDTKGTGACLNCGEKIPTDRRWCNKECAEDWEYYNKHKNT